MADKFDKYRGHHKPTLLTPEVEEAILEDLREGNCRSTAAEHNGVARSTMSTWVKLGREGHEVYAAFLAKMVKAEAEAECTAVKTVRKAIDLDNVTAAIAWLERRRPKTWGRKDTVKVQPLPNPKEMTTAQLEHAIRAAADTKARMVN